MRKTYQLVFAFVLMALYAMDASAGLKRVPLTTDMFFTWSSPGADAKKTSDTPAGCSWEVGKPSQMIYGDGNVSPTAYADLSAYTTLEIYYSSGTPRPMLNRDVDNGTWDATEENSHLIEYPKGGDGTWSGKYFTNADGVLKVDLAQLVADKGYAHLHAIKGANWADCVVDKLALISSDGRVELEAEMFHCWTTDGADAEIIEEPEPFTGGETFGCEVNYFKNVDGGNVIYGNGNVIWQWYADLTGTKKMYFTGEKGISFRVLYNRQPPMEGDTDNHGHACPEKVVTIGDDGTAVLDVEAFMAENSLTYFHVNCIKIGWGASSLRFGNVELEGSIQGSGKVYDPLDDITAGFQADVVALNLGTNTNLKDLLGENEERLIFPNECAKLTVNGKEIKLISVEAYQYEGNARLFLFIDDINDQIDETDENVDVRVTFINPTDEKLQLKYKDGRYKDMAVPDVMGLKAEFEDGLGNNYTNQFKMPKLIAAVPEVGSINLPVDQTEFKVMFSGNVNAAELKATFDGKAMTFAPAEGVATEFTLTRAAGDVTPGIHTIQLTNIKPEFDLFEEVGEETIKYSFGIIESDETVETLMTDGFAESGNSTVPAAWIVDNEGEDRSGVSNIALGCRVVETSGSFATHVLYICSRNLASDGHAIYGANDQKLTLEAKTYHLTADFGGWDGVNRALKVQVLSEETEEIIAETLEPVTVTYTSGDKNHLDLEFAVTTPGNYILKFFPCNLEGNPGGWGDALAIGNIKVQYIPNVMGVELMQALKSALENATTVRDNYASDRYAGEAFTSLNELVNKYTTEVVCQPSDFDAAVAALKAAADALSAHAKLCDDFDALPAQLYAKLPKADSKFATTATYTEVKAVFDKYATVTTVAGEEGETEVVTPKLITNDDELKAAKDELNKAITLAGMFTTGASQNTTTGYAALNERIRRGIENLKAMGVSEDDALIVEASKEFGDDDSVAQAVKTRTAKEFYTNYNNMFADGQTYDFSVFIKNPNIYVTKTSKQDFDAAPGWTLNNIGGTSLGDIWYTAGGGTHFATDDVPADEAITSTGNVAFTQEITDLPAGVYTVTAYMGERRSDNDFKGFGEGETDDEKLADARAKVFPKEFFFVNTSATAEGEYDNQTPVASNGTSWGATDNNRIISQEITIIDGKATIGVRSLGENTWFALNDIYLNLVAAAAGFDYAKALSDLASIMTLDNTAAKVRAIQLFDINGRRVVKAQKGINIVKKVMSDGSIKTEKVIVK
jgi:hypothetical protein